MGHIHFVYIPLLYYLQPAQAAHSPTFGKKHAGWAHQAAQALTKQEVTQGISERLAFRLYSIGQALAHAQHLFCSALKTAPELRVSGEKSNGPLGSVVSALFKVASDRESSCDLARSRRVIHRPNVNSSNPVQQPEEQVQIVDDNNNPIGSASRQDMRQQRMLHRCSFVITRNSKV